MKGRLRKAEGLRGCGPKTAPINRTKREFMMLPAHQSEDAACGLRVDAEEMKWT